MVEKYLKKIAYLMMSAIGIAGIHSCANMGSGPQGGPRDMTPPKYIFSTPERSAVNAKPQKAEIIFGCEADARHKKFSLEFFIILAHYIGDYKR